MPVCEGCGASFQDDFEFCPHCGRAKPETPKIEVDVKVSPRNSPYDCPLCGDAMNAQKVTAIVSSGTSKGSQQSTTQGSSGYYSASSGKKVGDGYSSSTTRTSSHSQSNLAAKLSLPNPPQKPPSHTWTPGCWPMGIVGFLVLTVVLQITDESFLWTIILTPIITGLIMWGIGAVVNSINDSDAKNQADNKEYEAKMKIYQNAKSTWEKLYYCHKHDIVFMSGSKKHAPVNDAWAACVKWGSEKK